ncbi:MAG: PIN domain-containing protein [Prevotella sp.]|nr:PIN domain-containing protein [Prevotella sp.]
MKVFLDTNIFLEYFERRREYQAVDKLLSAVEDGKLKAVVSVGCVYTLAYLVRVELKRQGIHRPEQTLRLRSTFNTVMSMVTAVGLSHKQLSQGINDLAFDDVEDSFQY